MSKNVSNNSLKLLKSSFEGGSPIVVAASNVGSLGLRHGGKYKKVKKNT